MHAVLYICAYIFVIQSAVDEIKHFDTLINAKIQLYIEVALKPHFGEMIQFVIENEPILDTNNISVDAGIYICILCIHMYVDAYIADICRCINTHTHILPTYAYVVCTHVHANTHISLCIHTHLQTLICTYIYVYVYHKVHHIKLNS